MKIAFYAKDGSFYFKDIILANKSETVIDCDSDSYVAILPNYKDESFIKVCLDNDSLLFFKENLNVVKEPGARILIWRSFYDMVRDAKIASSDFFELVERFLPSETQFTLLEYVFIFSKICLFKFTPSENREKFSHILFMLVKKILLNEKSNSENIAILKNKLIAFAIAKEDLEQILAFFNKTNEELKFLDLNLENEWKIVKKVVFSPHFSENTKQELIAKLIEKDSSDIGIRNKIKCETVFLNEEGRSKLWISFISPDPTVSEKIMAAQMKGFNSELKVKENEKYVDSYFSVLNLIFEKHTSRYATTFLETLFPVTENFEKIVKKVDEIVKNTPEKLSKLILGLKQERDNIQRRTRCYEKFMEKIKI
jgi:aminopeptidase N